MQDETIATQVPGGGWVDHVVWGTPDTKQAARTLSDQLGIAISVNMTPDNNYPTLSTALSLGG